MANSDSNQLLRDRVRNRSRIHLSTTVQASVHFVRCTFS